MAGDRAWRFTTAAQASPAAPSTTVVFTAVADARVEKAHPKANYGKARKLRARGGSSPSAESYLRFVVKGLSGSVQSAKLRLYVTDGTTDGPAVYSTRNAWIESGAGSITWKRRPGPKSMALDGTGGVPAKSWVEYDVTSLVKGAGTFSFVLVSKSSDAMKTYSREQPAKGPQLVVTTD